MAAEASTNDASIMDVDVDSTGSGSSSGSVQLSEGLNDIYTRHGKFSACEIKVDSLFELQEGRFQLQEDTEGFLDLSCLDAFRQEDDTNTTARTKTMPSFFVPKKIYVRPEMQLMFNGLLTKSNPAENKTILTGSPGIGKSVLLFLVALRYQLLSEVKDNFKVAYIRKVDDEPAVSLFLMEPGDQPSTVRVVFSRAIRKEDYASLFEMWNEFRGYTEALEAEDYLEFIDGPRHHEKLDLINNDFRFLCTSGGYPPRHQSEIMSTEVKILSGWAEDTIVSFLCKMGLVPEQACRVYSFSGGRVRLSMWGLQENGISRIKKWFNELFIEFGQEKIALAVTKTDSSASASSSDRLRTRFVNYDGKGESLLIVDSAYVVDGLRSRLDFGDFMSAFQLAGVCGLRSARGWFFEEIMHLWFKANKSSAVHHWLRSDGSATDGIAAMDKENLYWIPSTSNFANIDAAIVVGSILVCIQYTVSDTHAFDKETFWSEFISHIRSKLGFSSVEVWFVSPNGTDFQLYHVDYSQPCPLVSTALRSHGPLPTISISFQAAEVTCESMETLDCTAPKLGFLQTDSEM
jgi:hypothetical protein